MEIKKVSSIEEFREMKSVTFSVEDFFINVKMNPKHKDEVWSIWDKNNEDFRFIDTANIRDKTHARNSFSKEAEEMKIIDSEKCKNILVLVSNELYKIEKEYPAYYKEESQQEPSNIKKTSSVIVNDVLYEQVYDKENGVRFVFLDYDGMIRYCKSISDGELIYIPIDDEEAIGKNIIKLPTKPEAYGTFESLINSIQTHITKWLDVSENFMTIAVYTIPFYWLFDRFKVLHYLRARGDTGSGKSRFLDTIGGLSYKPMMVSGAITVSPIFRLLNTWKGTLILDEADFRNSDEKNEVVTVLNCGYEVGRPVIRADVNEQDKVIGYDVYSPKILATRQDFDDKALESRCMTEIMQQTMNRKIPIILTDEFFEEQQSIRNQLLMFRLENWNKIKIENYNDVLDDIEPRLQQITKGLLAVIRDEKIKKDFIDFLKKMNKDLIEERSISLDGGIVNAIHDLLKVGIENGQEINDIAITSADIGTKMLDYDFFYRDKKTGEKKPVSSQKIGKRLKSLNGTTVQKRIDGNVKRIIVFEPKLFNLLFKRYVFDCSNIGNKSVPCTVCTKCIGELHTSFSENSINILQNKKNSVSTYLLEEKNKKTEKKKFFKPPFSDKKNGTNGTTVQSGLKPDQKEYSGEEIGKLLRQKSIFVKKNISNDDLVSMSKANGEIHEIKPNVFVFT